MLTVQYNVLAASLLWQLVGNPAHAQDCSSYSVVLESFGASKVNVIKAVREITPLGLREAKELVESAPVVILSGLTEAEAASHVSRLQDAGATASSECEDEEAESAAEEEEASAAAAADCGTYSVVLESFGASKVNVIKAVREITPLGLREAKELVESAPVVILSGLTEAEAASHVSRLQDAGGAASSECEDEEAESAAEEEEASEADVADCGSYSLVLESFGASKVNVIKAVREITPLGLREAKELVESAPVVILSGLTEAEAASHVSRLQDAGATANSECEE